MTKAELKQYKSFLEKAHGDETAAMHLYLQWKCLTDLYFLGTKILGLEGAKEGSRSRIDPKFHGWLTKMMQPNKDALILVPRDHMKSTWLKIKIIQMILQQPNIRICLVSRTASLVESQLADIKTMFNNQKLIELFPEIVVPPGKRFSNWVRATNDELTITRNKEFGRIPQENQIEAWGMGATITGRHYDVICFDDILNEQSCSTPDQIEKQRSFYAYMQAIKDPEGFEIIVGTRYHFQDLYGLALKENWFKNRAFVREAIENGKPIYSFYTLKMLADKKRKMGTEKFAAQFMNNPLPSEMQMFTPPFPTYKNLPDGQFEYYMTVDPAATAETYSDETAMVVTAYHRGFGHLYTVEAIGLKEKPNIVAEKIVSLMAQYKPRRIGVEWGLQTALKYIIDAKLKEYEQKSGLKIPARFEAIKISRDLSKADRVNASLGAFYRDNKIFIHETHTDLMKQMEFFPKWGRDDLVDALSMQLQLIDNFASTYWDMGVDPVTGGRRKTFREMFGPQKKNTWDSKFVA